MNGFIIKEIAIERIKRVKPHVVMSEYGAGYERGLKDAIGIINATPAADVQPVPQWIRVKDKLPEDDECEVLAWVNDGIVNGIHYENSMTLAYWYKDEQIFVDYAFETIKGITHWMYTTAIPEPPKDGDAE